MTVNGAIGDKPARQVLPGDALEIAGPPSRYVGRGAHKLVRALDAFDIDPAGRRCLDVGASTGGFTDALLQRGAVTVVALDAGHGQLHERLRADSRVHSMERTNIRHVGPDDIGGPFDLVAVDVSFISLQAVIDSLAAETAESGVLIALVKPQFEAGRVEASRARGVITDPAVWSRTLDEVTERASRHGLGLRALTPSPIRGADGNVEFLARFDRFGPTADPRVLIAAAIAMVADQPPGVTPPDLA